MKTIKIGDFTIGGGFPLGVIAGPCVIEDENSTFEMAKTLQIITQNLGIPFVFKASYDKANRTSVDGFRGPGIDEGLNILSRIKKELGIVILTDVHCKVDVDKVSEVADIVQIPAFLSRQTDLIKEVAKKANIINIKKGQFLAPWDMAHVIQKVESMGNKNIIITERGTSFGYNQLVSDMCALPIMRKFGYPVVFDVTHSLQLPGGMGDKSGGKGEFVPNLARAAVACGCDMVFLEIHHNPDKALSDAQNSLALDKLTGLLEELQEIDSVVRKKQ